jgi:hypothetical protein
MVPKFKLEEVVVRRAVAAIPVPLSETVFGVVEASVITLTLPDKAPAVFGVKITSNVDWPPAAIVSGRVMPETVTPAALALALVTVKLDVPLFVTVTDCDAVEPRLTLPNLIAAGATEIAVDPVGLEALDVVLLGSPVSPVQPEMERIAMNKSNRAATGIAFVPADRACFARLTEQLNDSYVYEFFIAVIVVGA